MKLPNLSIKLPASKNKSVAQPSNNKATAGGRSLLVYFLPGLGVGVLVIAVLIAAVVGTVHHADVAVQQTAAEKAGKGLARQVASAVDARRQQLRVLARSPEVLRGLRAHSAPVLMKVAAAAEDMLPGVLQLRLFDTGTDVLPDPTGPAPLGYAGVQMIRDALDNKEPRAEVQQLDTRKPYLGLAVPVRQQGKVIGALYGAWPVAVLRREVAGAMTFRGGLQLLQAGAVAIARSGVQTSGSERLGQAAVPGTRFEVAYGLQPIPLFGQMGPLLTIGGAGVLVLLLALWLQYRMLSRDLRSDMATLVELGEAILSGEGSGERKATIGAANDAVLLLTDYARQSYKRGGMSPEGERASRSKLEQTDAPAALAPIPPPAEQEPPPEVPETIFRGYDIRGLAGPELSAPLAAQLGRAFAAYAAERSVSDVWIGHDARLSSPELYQATIGGLVAQGMHVFELGMVPAGLLYYAMHTRPKTATVLVTGSHNPIEYNGFKLYLEGQPVFGKTLYELRGRMLASGVPALPPGERSRLDVRPEYRQTVTADLQLPRPLRVVVDGGNGAAGELACELLTDLGCDVQPLFCEPDGHFPNHHPDPGQKDTLVALSLQVQATDSDLGIALDGDGDRLGVVDEQGEIVRPEHVLMMLAGDVLLRHPGSDVIYDVKSSAHLAAYILSNGGRPIIARAGHALMKEKLRETGALIGGEYSGHYYIKERWFGSDDAVYAAARFLEVISMDARPVSEQLADLPVSPATDELQLPLGEGEAGPLMQTLRGKADFGAARIIDIDGLRVEFDDGWGLVRASNTQPALTFRFEADTEAALERIQQDFRELINQVLPDRQLPF